jgi:hypothetical protein
VLSACVDFLFLLEEVCCVACALKQGFFISWDETKTTCESWRDERAKSAHKKGESLILRKATFWSLECRRWETPHLGTISFLLFNLFYFLLFSFLLE